MSIYEYIQFRRRADIPQTVKLAVKGVAAHRMTPVCLQVFVHMVLEVLFAPQLVAKDPPHTVDLTVKCVAAPLLKYPCDKPAFLQLDISSETLLR